ncbi:autotransporter outer membrane beta-barrel domain-containing protein [Phenylobacterium sp. LjRoot219]|uniref:autotransporter outer membrane beta-barrel domain-containing protein n=1 Tax=Phenylobacterium sp. LjRoot219 TaxID=3342283 RepID=UPI003ED02E34
MKRLFLSAALAPLTCPVLAHAETTISTAVTTPVRTATAASGQPDAVTISTSGSIKPTAAGAAVTMDAADKAVANKGAISFEGVNDATGVLLVGGAGGGLTNSGTISVSETYTAADSDNDGELDGVFAQGSNRYGIRATGAGAFTGDVRNEGTITVKGNDSAGISLETTLQGALVNTGAVSVVGDRTKGFAAAAITGDARLSGAITAQGEGAVGVHFGDVGGAVVLQGTVTATGYRYTERLADAARAKLDAEDLKQGGGAVRLTGSVAKGVLLDRPPADSDANDADEDDDGVADASEATAILTSYGSAPALDLGGAQATSFGVVGTGDLAFGLVNKGQVLGRGLNDGVAATALRIGQEGGGVTTVAGGINNLGGTIDAVSYGAQSTALLVNPTGVVSSLRNSGTVSATQNGGQHDARAIVDRSGTLDEINNSGVIRTTIVGTTGQTTTGRAIAIDLSANTSGALVRQAKVAAADAPEITGDVLFGAGDDRLELLAGKFTGALEFGAGADTLTIDGAAQAAARLSDSDGRLGLDIRNGRLTVANVETVRLTSFNLGAQGVLGVTIDPAANAFTRFEVAGGATLADGAKIDVSLTSLLRGSQSYELLHAQSLQAGQASAALSGAPYLYQASLRTEAQAGSLFLDLRPKTAAEIGLNRSSAQAYSAVFDVLDRNAGIENAFLSQTSRDGFLALYDQMLPDHSGGALMSTAAISTAISAATATPMRIGDAATGLWAQEIAFGLRRDRDQAQGYDAHGFGLAAGAETMGDHHALGVTTSLITGEYKDRGAAAGEQVAMSLVSGGLYWRINSGGLQAHARAGLGYVWFDGERRLAADNLSMEADADWNGWTVDAHAGASYAVELGRFYARPGVSIDYVRLSEQGYRESGGGAGFDLEVEDRKGDLLTGEAALALGVNFGDQTIWSPELKLGWRERLAGDPGRTTARFADGEAFTLDPEQPFDHAVTARLGLRVASRSLLFTLDGGGAFEGDYQEYDVRALIRTQF